MSRLNAKWFNFTRRGQTWDHFWQDAAVGPVTYQSNFNLDAVLRKEASASLSLDAVLRKEASASLSLDAVLLKTGIATYDLDAVLLKAASDTFDLDAVLLSVFSDVFAVDAVLFGTQVATYDLDAVLLETLSAAFNLDAIQQETLSASLDLDALLLKEEQATFVVDVVVFAEITASFGLDAEIVGSVVLEFSLDAVLSKGQPGSFGLSADIAVLGFGINAWIEETSDGRHHRTYNHRDTEDCTTVVLVTDIGRYAAGTSVCEVVADLRLRLAQVDADYIHGFAVFGADAFLAPYDPGALGGGLLSLFGMDAVFYEVVAASFGADAVIVSADATYDFTFGVSAYILDLAGNAATQLMAAINDTQTIITVNSATGFPTVGEYLIQIDGETMLVTGGQGTTTWTVVRGYGGTPADHAAGAVVVDC